MRKPWLLTLFIVVTLTLESQAAVFAPFYMTVEFLHRRTHWLARAFRDQAARDPECALNVAAEGSRWLSHGYFDRREKDFGIMFRLAEGGFISNKTPSEHHFYFSPLVLNRIGVTLFEHYGKTRPVSSLSLVHDEWAEPYQEWAAFLSDEKFLKHWAQIRTLRLSADALSAFSNSPSFPNLESLLVDANGIDAVVRVLNSAHFPNLKRLTIGAQNVSAEDLSQLIAAKGFERITELAFRNINFGDAGFEILANSPALAHIEALFLDAGTSQLCDNRPSYAGFKRLFQSPHLSALTKLSVDAIWEFDPIAIDVLAEWSGLASLEYLDLHTTKDPQSVAAMLRNKRFDRLQELQLRGTDYNNDLLQALAKNKSFASLERMAVDLSPDIHPGTVRSVVNAPHLKRTTIAYDMKQLGE